jgi:hypothetical protein
MLAGTVQTNPDQTQGKSVPLRGDARKLRMLGQQLKELIPSWDHFQLKMRE